MAQPQQSNPLANVVPLGLRKRAFDDIYHALLRASWLRLMILIASVYFGVNAIFGVAYLLVGGIEGVEAGSFGDTFFFSVQTMNTIGYGRMVPVSRAAHLLVSIEAFTGLLGFAMVTGLVFSKFARPTARVMFSAQPVIGIHDGNRTFQFRVANERANQIVEAQLRVVMLRTEITKEGVRFRRIRDIPLVRSSSSVFIMTWTAMHAITPDSPFHEYTPESYAASDCQLVISMTGLDETFGQTIHARHWYAAKDVRWNARFVDLFVELPGGRRGIDYGKFNDVVDEPPGGAGNAADVARVTRT